MRRLAIIKLDVLFGIHEHANPNRMESRHKRLEILRKSAEKLFPHRMHSWRRSRRVSCEIPRVSGRITAAYIN